MRLPRPLTATTRSWSCSSLFFATGQTHGWAEFSGRALHALAVIVLPTVLPAMFLLRSNRDEMYNILWAMVFGFAMLNILSLGALRFEEEYAVLDIGRISA